MSDAFKDFYAGFEGEPEFLFSVDGRLRLRCWEGHLSAFLDTVLPEQGRWTGLAKAYHLDLWDDHPWQVTNNAECLAQLQQARMDDDVSAEGAGEANEVRLSLINLFRDAVATGGLVIVRRD